MIVPMIMIVMMVVMVMIVPVLEDRLHAGSYRHVRRRLRVELLAEQQHQCCPE